jgi:hypothetical protein
LSDELSIIDFPTGKKHVSYSEIRGWKECPYRHKLQHIDKIGINEPSPYLSYGSAIHNGIEKFLLTGKMDIQSVLDEIKSEWDEHGLDSKEFIAAQANHRKQNGWKPKEHLYLPVWLDYAKVALNDLPSFLKNEFGDYTVISAEEQLYEHFPESNIFFKGFIDAVIKTNIRGKDVYYVIDWKTAGDKGWYKSKREDILTWAQIALYKRFWRTKNDIPIKDVRCGFVLLKRGAPEGSSCDLVKVSVGPKAEEKSLSILRSMVKAVRRGLFLKNRNSCLFCEFKNTTHCP